MNPAPESLRGCYGALVGLYVVSVLALIFACVFTERTWGLIPTGIYTVICGWWLDRLSEAR